MKLEAFVGQDKICMAGGRDPKKASSSYQHVPFLILPTPNSVSLPPSDGVSASEDALPVEYSSRSVTLERWWLVNKKVEKTRVECTYISKTT